MSEMAVSRSSSEPTVPHVARCCLSGDSMRTTTKVAAVVLGLLLVAVGIALYFTSVNVDYSQAVLNCALGCGGGGLFLLGAAIWSILDCMRGKNEAAKGVREHSIDLSAFPGNPSISRDEVADLLSKNPNLQRIEVRVRPHRMDTDWDTDFDALEAHFTKNQGKSSGVSYVYERNAV